LTNSSIGYSQSSFVKIGDQDAYVTFTEFFEDKLHFWPFHTGKRHWRLQHIADVYRCKLLFDQSHKWLEQNGYFNGSLSKRLKQRNYLDSGKGKDVYLVRNFDPHYTMLKDYFECWDVPGNGHCGFASVAVALTGTHSSQFLVRLLSYLSYLKNDKDSWTRVWVGVDQRTVFEKLLRNGECTSVGIDSWYCNLYAGQLVASALKCPVYILHESSKDRTHISYNLPRDIPFDEWKKPLYLYMPNSAHFNLLIPKSNVEKLPFFPLSPSYLPRNIDGLKEYIRRYNLKVIGKHFITSSPASSCSSSIDPIVP
jgi:hypothetical protein